MLENKIKHNIFSIGNLKIIHGVSWFPIISIEAEEADLKDLINEKKPGLIVRVAGIQDGSTPVFGLVEENFVKENIAKKQDVYSLGAIFSELCKENIFDRNSIFLLDLNNDNSVNNADKNIVMVIIEDYLPVSGSEIFDNKINIYNSLKNKWFTNNNKYSIYTYNINNQELSFIPTNLGVHELDINIINSLKNKQLNKCKLNPIVKKTDDKKKLLLLIGGVCLMAFVFWENIMNFVMPPSPPSPPVDYKKLYQTGIKKILQNEKFVGLDGLQKLNTIIKEVPLSVGGWNLNKIQCKKNCVLEYMPKDLMPTNYSSFQKYAKQYIDKQVFNNLNYDLNGKSIKVDYGKPEQYKNIKNNMNFKNLPSMKIFKTSVFPKYQDLTKLGLTYKFDKNKNIAVSGVSLGKIKSDFISKGKFSLSGNGWFLHELPINDNMAVNDLTISFNFKNYITKFDIKGTYYIKESKNMEKKS